MNRLGVHRNPPKLVSWLSGHVTGAQIHTDVDRECVNRTIMEAADPRCSSGGEPASRDGFPGRESSSSGRDGGEGEGPEPRDRERATFECNICLDTATDAVISLCGHLFW